ncbi:coagulation factor 5/8 type domain-containing protein [Fimbriimonas ginsengisoli Gsoil 348]|uniref:alpha-L-fucosidase n=2 Tax=Fimbriimonas ginsengisoli TaxID=1005039 RepID=A0A068NRG8_FIMGI|nr:coagulation factor 5/8 type domain-containing protein [Fimbriimonas ginsengisoli Gsoil 348]
MEPYAKDRPLHELQQAFLDLRFGMFIHFNMATFQDREWGDPTSPPDLFNPTHLDTDQWAEAAKSAGMTWGCLTTKHHDGFCIWPTATRSASVRHTAHKTDVVRAYVDSFRKHGLKVALYFSILDLREDIRHFDVTPDKIQLIKDQLTELFTHYGEIDALIIDGWDAPWSRITYEEVPFHEIYGMLKKLQPNCLISDLNASQYPPSGLYYTDLKAFEQNAGQHLPEESSVPAFSCVTITDGWFWRQSDVDGPLKTTKQVVEEWLVPQNARHCSLILNAPPTREGRFAPNVVERLKEIGQAWKHGGPTAKIRPTTVITTSNLATGRPIKASSSPDTVGPDLANDGNFNSSWYPDSGRTEAWLEVDLGANRSFNTLVLVEPVGKWKDYQESRIKSYRFQAWSGGSWHDLVVGNSPQRVQMHEIPRTKADRLRLHIEFTDPIPHISEIGVYDEPRS